MSAECSKAERYVNAWASSLARLLSQLGSAEWRVETVDSSKPSAPVYARATAKGGLPGGQWFALGEADAGKLLQLFLSEEVRVESGLDDMQKEAMEELLRQWCGLAATELRADFGELSFEVAISAAPVSEPESGVCLLATDGSGGQSIALRMDIDAELRKSLDEQEEFKQQPEETPVAASGNRITELLQQGNLDLLMDVELPVMLRFGTRRATLREVLDLATGAVLELDREIQEPVDLVLNGKLIARGEVVVVDGNYGLRVIEVAPPQQRVNSL